MERSGGEGEDAWPNCSARISYQLDPKGRISLPARFRDAFADGAVLTLGQDGCLFCFPRAEWDVPSG